MISLNLDLPLAAFDPQSPLGRLVLGRFRHYLAPASMVIDLHGEPLKPQARPSGI
jgi:hypothetical protein